MVQVTMPNLPSPVVDPKTGAVTRPWQEFFRELWRRSGEFGDVGSLTDGDKGDITVATVGTVWTVDSNAITTTKIIDNAVTLAKMAQVLTASFLGRNTAGTDNVERLSIATARTMLNVEDGADVTDATNVNAAGAVMETDYNANTVLAATSNNTPVVLTVAEQTLVGRITSGNIAALTVTQIRTLLNVEDGADVTDATNVKAAVDIVERLNVNTTEVGNVGAGEDDLITYSLASGSLSANGEGVRVTAWGITANTANAKEVKVYFGSAVISPGALTLNQTSVWRVTFEVFRTGADTQDYVAIFKNHGGTVIDLLVEGTLTETEGAGITIKCTGEAVANDDIVQKGMIVEFFN